MVAARPANLLADVRLASGGGELLLGPSQIESPRWRCDAIARIAPALVQHGIVIDRLRAQLREGLRAAPCPAPLRDELGELLLGRLADAKPEALARIVTALWSRAWPPAKLHAAAAHLALGDIDRAREHGGGPHATWHLRELLRTGCLEDRFIADARIAEAFTPTVPMIEALVEAGIEPRVLPEHDRDRAIAHLARLDRRRARSLPTASARSGAYWWIAREHLAAGRFDDASAFAAEIEAPLLRQYATVELARSFVTHRRYADALHALRDARDPRLACVRNAVKRVILLCLRTAELPLAHPRHELHRKGWTPASWLRPLDGVRQDEITMGLHLLRAALARNEFGWLLGAAFYFRVLLHDPIARREANKQTKQIGAPITSALAVMQCLRPALDAYSATELVVRAERATAAPALREGLAAALPPTNDPRSLARALYDEGLALSPHAPRRRRVLIAAAQHCLRAALAQPADWSAAALEVRLHTLVHLGGSLAADAIAKAVATLPFEPELEQNALAHLALLDPHRALELAVPRLGELHVPVELLRACELCGALAAGFARAFANARRLRVTKSHTHASVT